MCVFKWHVVSYKIGNQSRNRNKLKQSIKSHSNTQCFLHHHAHTTRCLVEVAWGTATFNTLWGLWRTAYETSVPKMEKSWALLSEQPGLLLHLSSARAWLPPYRATLLQLSTQSTLERYAHFYHFYIKYLFVLVSCIFLFSEKINFGFH